MNSHDKQWHLMLDPGIAFGRWSQEGLNPTDVKAMLVLSSYARNSCVAWPSNDRLCQDLGKATGKGFQKLSVRGLDKILERLTSLGKVHSVYRDAKKRERAGIVLLDRESGVYPVPAVSREAMTAQWVDAVKRLKDGTSVPSTEDLRPTGMELQFHRDRTPVPGGWNSSSMGDGTPVPQNKEELKYNTLKKDKEKPTPLPPTADPKSTTNGVGGDSPSAGEDKTTTATAQPRPATAVPESARSERISAPRIDARPPERPITQAIPADALEAARAALDASAANEIQRRSEEFIAKANGDVAVVVAAIGAMIKAVRQGGVTSPIGLLVKRIEAFAADRIPAEFEDQAVRRKREELETARRRAMNRSDFESEVKHYIVRCLRPSNGPDAVRKVLSDAVAAQGQRLGLTEDQSSIRRGWLAELTTDEAMVATQHNGVFGLYVGGRIQDETYELLSELNDEGRHTDAEIERLIIERLEARDVNLCQPLSEYDRQRRVWIIQKRLHKAAPDRFASPDEPPLVKEKSGRWNRLHQDRMAEEAIRIARKTADQTWQDQASKGLAGNEAVKETA